MHSFSTIIAAAGIAMVFAESSLATPASWKDSVNALRVTHDLSFGGKTAQAEEMEALKMLCESPKIQQQDECVKRGTLLLSFRLDADRILKGIEVWVAKGRRPTKMDFHMYTSSIERYDAEKAEWNRQFAAGFPRSQ